MQIFKRTCLNCPSLIELRQNTSICESCLKSFQGDYLDFEQGCSFLIYRGAIANQIKNIKINHSLASYKLIYDLILSHPNLSKALDGVTQITPAPSSAYSRAFGRFDLAAMFASDLAIESGLSFRLPPNELFWKWKKRSQSQRSARSIDKNILNDQSTEEPYKILIIDDVLTTGHTLRRVSQSLFGAKLCFLTLAYSTFLLS